MLVCKKEVAHCLLVTCCVQGRKNHCVAVIGDGAITGGMAYEAMNHAGFLDKNMIVILNDNQQVCSSCCSAAWSLSLSQTLFPHQADAQPFITLIPPQLYSPYCLCKVSNALENHNVVCNVCIKVQHRFLFEAC